MTARRVLVLDDRVPRASDGAGYPRAAEIVRVLAAEGFAVTLYPLHHLRGDPGEVARLFPGVEVVLGLGVARLEAFLAERRGTFDVVLVSRPYNMLIVRGLLWEDIDLLGGARLVYDAESLFARREIMRREAIGEPVSEAEADAMIAEEVSLAAAADHAIAVSEEEAEPLRRRGLAVGVVGHAIAPAPTPESFGSRRGLLFVGRLDDPRSPNVDGLRWFVEEVLPRIEAFTLDVVGKGALPEVTALAGARVRLRGEVDDLSPIYATARVFVAPARFGAGIPHKVHEAAARGVPAVVTPLLARQLGWADGGALRVGGDAATFAAAVADLYRDAAAWTRIRAGALAKVAMDCSLDAFKAGLLAAVS